MTHAPLVGWTSSAAVAGRTTSDSCRVLSKDLVMVVGGATCHVGSARGHLCEVCQLDCPLDVPLDNLRMFLVQLHQCVCVEPYWMVLRLPKE